MLRRTLLWCSLASWRGLLSSERLTERKVTEAVRHYPSSQSTRYVGGSGSETKTIPVRTLIAQQSIARGEVVAEVPLSRILDGRAAAVYLQFICSTPHKRRVGVPDSFPRLRSGIDRVIAGLHASSSPSSSSPGGVVAQYMHSTSLHGRDGIFLLLTLYFMRHLETEENEWKLVQEWVKDFPKKAPPLGLLLHECLYQPLFAWDPSHSENGTKPVKKSLLQRQLRFGDHTQLLLQEEEQTEETGPRFLPDTEEEGVHNALETVPTSEKAKHTSKERQLEQQKQELLLRAVEEEGLQVLSNHQGGVRTEVVVTPEIKRNYLKENQKQALMGVPQDNAFLMSVRQWEGKSNERRQEESESVKQLMALSEALTEWLLHPLAELLYETASPARTEETEREAQVEQILKDLQWTHFMLRSRAVQLHAPVHTADTESGSALPVSSSSSGRGRPSSTAHLSLVPFLDRVNHATDGVSVNVTYSLQTSPTAEGAFPESVLITAAKPIRKGEELFLNYTNSLQRGPPLTAALFDPPAPHRPPSVRQSTRKEIDRLELNQRLEFVKDDDEDGVEGGEGGASTSERGSNRVIGTVLSAPSSTGTTAAALEAQREVNFLFAFGFMRSETEKNNELHQLWSKNLTRRAAALTDIRVGASARKDGGDDESAVRKRAEFVIGVPEGLRYLKQQRYELEKEKYNAARVFPPQREGEF